MSFYQPPEAPPPPELPPPKPPQSLENPPPLHEDDPPHDEPADPPQFHVLQSDPPVPLPPLPPRNDFGLFLPTRSPRTSSAMPTGVWTRGASGLPTSQAIP